MHGVTMIKLYVRHLNRFISVFLVVQIAPCAVVNSSFINTPCSRANILNFTMSQECHITGFYEFK